LHPATSTPQLESGFFGKLICKFQEVAAPEAKKEAATHFGGTVVKNVVASGKSSTRLKETKKAMRIHDNKSGGMTSKSKTLAASNITLNAEFVDLSGLELESAEECSR